MRSAAIFRNLVLLLLTAAVQASAQPPAMQGVVLDSTDGTPLAKCTITIRQKDSTTTSLTSAAGRFSYLPTTDTAVILIEHIGYTTRRLTRTATKKEGVDTVLLTPADKLMEGIVIKAPLPPIVIHGDTTDFNIDSSMFEPYDVVGDLVKRLPGIEIDAAGGITYLGKPITRILVDGEDVFAGDPNFSMRKLPAGLVAKIQVMDTKTLEQLFSGTSPDGDDKTLNIKLKPGNKLFGSAGLAAGTQNQAGADASLSMFEEKRRINATTYANGSNNIGALRNPEAPSMYMSGTSLNYGNRWGKVRSNNSYSYTTNQNANQQLRQRTQVLTADTSIFTQSRNRFQHRSANHRLNGGGNWAIDSFSSLDVGLSLLSARNSSQSTTASATSENGQLRNQSNGTSASDNQSDNATLFAFYARRFKKADRNLSVNLRSSTGQQQGTVTNSTTSTYFKANAPVSGDTLNRLTKTTTRTAAYALTLSYSQALNKTLQLRLRADMDFATNATNRAIYNVDSTTKTSVFDSTYSAQIRSLTNTQNLTASVIYSGSGKWRLTTGLGAVLQQTARTLQGATIRQRLLRYSPTINGTYLFTKEKTLRLDFSGTTIQPTIDQLQPVPDNSNPLYIQQGNPNLRTSFAQSYSAGYNYYTVKQSVTAGLSYAPVSNQIVNAIYYDAFRRQTSRFINAGGVYNLRGNVAVSKTARQDKRYQTLALTGSGNYGRQVFFQSNQQYYTTAYGIQAGTTYTRREQKVQTASFTAGVSGTYNRNFIPANTALLNTTRLSVSPRVDVGFSLLKIVEVAAGYTVFYNRLNYHSAVRTNDEYSIHNVTNNLTFRFTKRYSLQSGFTYSYNTQAPVGAVRGVPSLNLSAGARVLKYGRGNMELAATNLLAPANNLRRVSGDNYIEDQQMYVLRNYFTFRFEYSFSRVNKKETVKK